MPKIEHIAIWCRDLEEMKDFYTKYFQAKAGAMYHNPDKGFTSYFLTFEDGCRLELMNKKNNPQTQVLDGIGYAHLAFSVGSSESVNALTQALQQSGVQVVGSPRTTGDGYYESLILDPEGNQVEITI